MTDENNEVFFAEERRAIIATLVNERKKVLVPELIEHFKVSPATIRTDLREMDAAGLIKRTHGGAIPNEFVKVGFEPIDVSKNVDCLKEKKQVARKAHTMVEDGDILILDTGTTTLELAKMLGDKQNITVIVNDIEIALCLEQFEGVNVIMISGALRKKFHCTIGPFATDLLSELHVDKVFLGTNAFSVQKGCTTPDINQAEVKKTMVRVAKQIIVLCDSSKIGKNSFVQFAPLKEIDVLITDNGIDRRLLDELTAKGIEVHTGND